MQPQERRHLPWGRPAWVKFLCGGVNADRNPRLFADGPFSVLTDPANFTPPSIKLKRVPRPPCPHPQNHSYFRLWAALRDCGRGRTFQPVAADHQGFSRKIRAFRAANMRGFISALTASTNLDTFITTNPTQTSFITSFPPAANPTPPWSPPTFSQKSGARFSPAPPPPPFLIGSVLMELFFLGMDPLIA